MDDLEWATKTAEALVKTREDDEAKDKEAELLRREEAARGIA